MKTSSTYVEIVVETVASTFHFVLTKNVRELSSLIFVLRYISVKLIEFASRPLYLFA